MGASSSHLETPTILPNAASSDSLPHIYRDACDPPIYSRASRGRRLFSPLKNYYKYFCCWLRLTYKSLWLASPRTKTLHPDPEANSLSTDACDPQAHPRFVGHLHIFK